MIKLGRKAPKVEHKAFYDALCAVMKKYGKTLSADELLAIASNFVGKLVAMQDQRTMTAEQALDIVIANLQEGNQQMIDGIQDTKGSA